MTLFGTLFFNKWMFARPKELGWKCKHQQMPQIHMGQHSEVHGSIYMWSLLIGSVSVSIGLPITYKRFSGSNNWTLGSVHSVVLLETRPNETVSACKVINKSSYSSCHCNIHRWKCLWDLEVYLFIKNIRCTSLTEHWGLFYFRKIKKAGVADVYV